MTRFGGQLARRLGLLIEVGCMLGAVSSSRRHATLAGFELDTWNLWIGGFVVGFALWLWGTFTLMQAQARSRVKVRSLGERDILDT